MGLMMHYCVRLFLERLLTSCKARRVTCAAHGGFPCSVKTAPCPKSRITLAIIACFLRDEAGDQESDSLLQQAASAARAR